MQIKQWEDKNLAQFSYAVLSDCEKKVVLIDPSRNPQQYLDYAKEHNATITGIIETHPHADFISSHVELSSLTGATIYTSSLVGAGYTHTVLDEGNTIELGKIRLTALHTPGHSPDSISILLEHDGKQKAVFSGDTLFIGDCGRPDLREGAGNLRGTRLELAKSMYHTLRDKFIPLNDDVTLYPAHGAGTLCGKGLSKANSSTMGQEKQTNWSLQAMTEEAFIKALLSDQPFVPAYFSYDVELNRKGAAPFKESVEAVVIGSPVENQSDADTLEQDLVVVDARKEKEYKKGHLPNSINLMEGAKFETWLGSIIKPGEQFYLAGESKDQLQRLVERAAAIGYEPQIKEAFVLEYAAQSQPVIDMEAFKENPDHYTIVDVRNGSEVKEGKPFKNSLSIPLPEVRNRVNEIPTDKPIVVHCAGGYRSAAGSSIIQSALDGKVKVFDLSDGINQF
ncbi:MBL fold metallo-hydrolase [Segetibacter sp.]|uniref:MBL fold metallo-hydrolase n=1 Tax=Segetibacter sp. TaxID=2231182 RepID=UPI0026117251|nr:MBL fold metallo-hydrolase [Segetibacter sp.]MCW3078622.1 sulfurtransferase [Segetibacter sp.]